MNGVWVAAINGNFPRQKERSSQKLKEDIDFIVERSAAMGFNAIFFQVRPSCDALYKSKIFPWSQWLCGRAGAAPDNDFDPLEYFCSAAHKKNVALHAWINPYRIKAKKGQALEEILAVNKGLRPLKKFILPSSDGNFYLDPGEPRVRDFVVRGAKEILKNYDVDGLHLDDYFYPDSGIDDSSSFKKYGDGSSLEDFRRESVGALIKSLGDLVKNEKPGSLFGVSPFGIWANKGPANPYGSQTKGKESYSAHFADSVAWIQRGLVDYIAPQIYWERSHKLASYEALARWWNDAVEGSGVLLYIGMADYKAAAARNDPKSPWHGTAELEAQLELNKELKNVSGEIHYNFDSLLAPGIKEFYENLANEGSKEYN